MKNNLNIAICIPSYNEADVINYTTSIIDNGLSEGFKNFNCLIINADNNSSDQTKEKFLNTRTASKKIYLNCNDKEKGKGYNLRNFWLFCKENSIDFAANIDADVKTIDKSWPYKLITPLVKKEADYITPLYTRNRFEGSTTNHFAFPLIYAVFGKKIRQPIGGEFAYSRKVYEYFLEQNFNLSSLGYGIDIFMSIHAIGGNFTTTEQLLGRKMHKPSFPKILSMYKEVFISGMTAIQKYKINNDQETLTHNSVNMGIDQEESFSHKEEAKRLLIYCLQNVLANKDEYECIFGEKCMNKILQNKNLLEKQWVEIFGIFFSLAIKQWSNKIDKLAKFILNLFIIRAVTFWLEAEKLRPVSVEDLIINQAKLIREVIIKSTDLSAE